MQEPVGGGVLEGADDAGDLQAAVEVAETGLAAAHHELLAEDVVRHAEQHLLGPVRCDLEPVHAEVEVAPLQTQDQAREGVLLHDDRLLQLPGDLVDDLHLETDVVVRVPGVLEDVGSAPLGVGAPQQGTGGVFGGARRGRGKRQRREENEEGGAAHQARLISRRAPEEQQRAWRAEAGLYRAVRSASTGCRREAFRAGYRPYSTPRTTDRPREIEMAVK